MISMGFGPTRVPSGARRVQVVAGERYVGKTGAVWCGPDGDGLVGVLLDGEGGSRLFRESELRTVGPAARRQE